MQALISRAEARALGLPRYFTGSRCRHDHIVERSTCRGACMECDRIYKRTSPVQKAARQRWTNNGSPAAQAHNRFKGQKTAAKEGNYARAPHERDCPPRPANSQCQCCSATAKLMLDHDHATGQFRGWVCAGCNARIGHVDASRRTPNSNETAYLRRLREN